MDPNDTSHQPGALSHATFRLSDWRKVDIEPTPEEIAEERDLMVEMFRRPPLFDKFGEVGVRRAREETPDEFIAEVIREARRENASVLKSMIGQ